MTSSIRIAIVAFAALGCTAAWAQTTPPAPAAPDVSKVEIKTTPLGHDTWELEGLGGNITVAAGRDGAVMVDTEFAPLHDKIKAAIAAVTSKPVKYVVNTHFHGDHVGGDAAFAADGAIIVAHVNVRARLAAGSVNALTGAKTPPAPPEALPTGTYTGSLALELKGRKVQLGHIRNAHTDGDTFVFLPDADVLATGDIVTLGRYPNIDVANGGTIDGMIAGVDAYLKLADAKTRIVPGHGPVIDRTRLADYRALLAGARDRVARLAEAGKSEDEAAAAAPLRDLDAQVGSTPQASANFTRLIYRSLKTP